MKPKFTLLVPVLIISISLPARQLTTPDQKYEKDSVITSYKNLFTELSQKHPGFYRYHSQKEMDAYIDSVMQTFGADSVSGWEIYRKMKPVISRIGCLHTGMGLSEKQERKLDSMANLFPLQLFFRDNKAWVVKNVSADRTIEPGTELTHINGRSIEEVLEIILPAIPSDGYNMTMKYLALYHDFPRWYRAMVEQPGEFTIGTIRKGIPGERKVTAVRKMDVAAPGFLTELKFPRTLEFEIHDKVGILSVHSFAKSIIKSGDQHFKKFIRSTFRELKKKKITNLVIDLRYNTGGTDANAAYFSRFFFDKPFRYWDRIEVTEATAKEIKGVYKLFYKKPVKKDSMYLWRKAWFTKEFNFYQQQQPYRNHFTGNVYVLINGFCMSSCADLAGVLAYNRKATFIGEETGGGYQGNNSGMMPETSALGDFILTVPLQKYYTAVDPAINFGRGTIPDHPVTPAIEQIIAGKDVVMQYALLLARSTLTTH